MSECDWCHAPMKRLGVVETGMMLGVASVWLCTRDGCGHESEIIDTVPGSRVGEAAVDDERAGGLGSTDGTQG